MGGCWSDLWATIATERGALANDLADLTPAQWETPSLCTGWTVRDVVAHLSATSSLNPATFLFNMAFNMAEAGFKFDKFTSDQIASDQIAAHRGADRAATLSEFRGLQNSTSAPPGPKPRGWVPVAVAVAGHDRPGRRMRRPRRPRGADASRALRPDALAT
ncbi:maleylpyruvate isomerase family mycothiol-dependent enzyme [Mycobacterium sp. 852002-51057_SCH5723018]|uniref:maleylpyruvate isomerase family mycothiol-dependent enzyme n=1 Tax=Mycobacterium sp. 852002-51057_SCH5723018 TaxID=1834094 RepID=UPI000A51AD19|nr:maleylpyruvate isomerase family mycothiol-dependent enzyme [Mycobacterium sp. 852002-51057_SCH5723018]